MIMMIGGDDGDGDIDCDIDWQLQKTKRISLEKLLLTLVTLWS
jgi:hypothetical protein